MKIILDIVGFLVIFAVPGGGLCGCTYLLLKYIYLRIWGYTTDDAYLADKEGGRRIYVIYTTKNGDRFYALTCFSGLIWFKEGKPVKVVYDPNRPDRAFIKGLRTLISAMLAIAFFLMVCIKLLNDLFGDSLFNGVY